MRVADWITKELIRMGVRRVYSVPGGFSQYLNDSLSHSDLQVVWTLDEKAAGFAACADAQYTGKLSICVVTSGPGSSNAISGCANAWLDSLPVLFISGDARIPLLETRDKYNLREAGPQDVPIKHMVEHITKMSITLICPSTIPDFFHTAVKWTMEPRMGPVWLNIPLDLQGMEI